MKKLMFAGITAVLLAGASFAVAQNAPGGAAAGAGAGAGAGAAACVPGPGVTCPPATGGAGAGAGAAGAGAAPGGNTAGGAAGGAAGNTAGAPAGAGGAGGAAGAGAGGNTTNVTVNITPEQRTQVRELIVAEKPQPVTNVTFNIVVGVAVPQTVTLHACPARLLDLVTGLKPIGCQYFILADGRIVIVRPDTKLIVLVIAA